MKVNESGRSMIEMLGVLAIVGVLSVGGIAGYSKAMQKYRTNKTIEQVTQIANGIRVLYSGQRSYGTNLSGTVLKRAKILPESAFDGAGSNGSDTPSNAFGGTINVGARKKLSGDSLNKAFYVQLNQIPEDACVELLSQDWGDATGLISYGTGSRGGDYFGCTRGNNANAPYACGGDGVMTMSAIMAACSGSNNTITWNFF